MASSFTIKTSDFEGPLDLLLGLIEKRKLFINDITLSKVADEYIEYTKRLREFPVSDTAHFILIASTLLLIKSKSLLPSLTLSEEEEAGIENLEARLALYQKVKEGAKHLEKRFGKKVIFFRTVQKNVNPVFSPDEYTTESNVIAAMKVVLQNLPKKEILPQTIVKKIISLEEVIDKLSERIQTGLKLNFSQFASPGSSSRGSHHQVTQEEKVLIIVSFLAMLELVKQGIVEATQEDFSEDISLETKKVGVPNYV
jgi:segregation and condensation protein A